MFANCINTLIQREVEHEDDELIVEGREHASRIQTLRKTVVNTTDSCFRACMPCYGLRDDVFEKLQRISGRTGLFNELGIIDEPQKATSEYSSLRELSMVCDSVKFDLHIKPFCSLSWKN